MDVGGANAAGNASPFVDREKIGFAGLTADDFMKMLIVELQNQDPTDPLSNEQLLNQLSVMRNLQSNIELSDTLKAITSSQQLVAATSFLGKTVAATKEDDTEISGVVDRVFQRDGKTFVAVADQEVPLSDITTVIAE